MGKNSFFLFALYMLMMVSCSSKSDQALEAIAAKTVDSIACKNVQFETQLWDGLKTYLIEQQEIPTASKMKQALHRQIQYLQIKNPRQNKNDFEQIKNNLDLLIDKILIEAPAGERVETSQQLLGLISALDVGDRSTNFRSSLQDRLRKNLTQLSASLQSYDLNCPKSGQEISEEPAPPLNTDYEYFKQQALAAGVPLAVFGQRWSFATAYQSCQSLDKEILNAETDFIKGIAITGKHSDGIGNKRVIASLAEVQTTHPYLKDIPFYGQGCFNVRLQPLIYDYGGKPYATTALSSPLDLFKNAGDGTNVLGIDCSGFVFTSMAAAGLKLKRDRPLKASDAWAWGSTSYLEPQNNGLTCLDKISLTPTVSLQSGDIVAVQGHVIMIDRVGEDPFGIAQARTEQDCAAVKSSEFDFIIAQSSPNVGAVGINRFIARDYLPTSAKMMAGLQKYAYYACLAKINNKIYKPNLGTLSVVRHKGTSDCMASRVALVNESCLQSCSASSFVR